MSHFKELKIDPLKEKAADNGIRKLDIGGPASGKPENFEIQPLAGAKKPSYGELRKKVGPIAVTDPGFKKTKKAFQINSVMKDALGIGEEEDRAVTELVKDKVEELRVEAEKSGNQKGYQEGFESGEKKGYEEYKTVAQEKLNELEKLIEGFESARVDVMRENESVLVDLVYAVARRVILKELSADRDYIKRLCVELVEHMGTRENVKILINQSSFDQIKDIKETLSKRFEDLRNLRVEVSSSVDQGCHIITEHHDLRATTEEQLENVLRALKGDEYQEPSPSAEKLETSDATAESPAESAESAAEVNENSSKEEKDAGESEPPAEE